MKAGSLWARPRFAWLAAICVCVIAVGLVPGVWAAAGTRAADVNLAYACQFPSGAQQVRVRVQSAFPATATVNVPIQPGHPTVSVTVPRTALGDLTKLGAAMVTGTVQLSTLVTQTGTSADTRWSGLTAPPTPIAKDGSLTFAASGQVPPVTVGATGDATFSAGDLTLTLTAEKADGTATTPLAMSVVCAPNLGQNTIMVTVPVSAGRPGPLGQGAGRRGLPVQALGECPPIITSGFNHDIPPFPKGFPDGPDIANAFVANNGPTENACAKVRGFSNINKLGASAFVRGGAQVSIAERIVVNNPYNGPFNYFQQDSVGFSVLTPPPATFLTFGFVPTTAKMEIAEIGNANIWSEAPFDAKRQGARPTVTKVEARVWLRISDVFVNGVPFDVGPHCGIARPMAIELTGRSDTTPPYDLQGGGGLEGTVNIPPFSGCGVHENLDALFTASVSGPGNHLSLLQGSVCLPDASFGCPPVEFGWTVTPGGTWSATAGQPYIQVQSPDFTTRNTYFNCQSSALNGTLRHGSRLFGTHIGFITGADFSGCNASDSSGNPAGAFSVAVHGLPWSLDATSYDLPSDTAYEQVNGVSLHISGPLCSFDAVGDPLAQYANPTSTLSLGGGNVFAANVNGCTGLVQNGDIAAIFGNYPFNGSTVQTIRVPSP
jgi:hypothetical protein